MVDKAPVPYQRDGKGDEVSPLLEEVEMILLADSGALGVVTQYGPPSSAEWLAGPVDLAAIARDPDALLAEDVLSFFTGQEEYARALIEADDASDVETLAALHQTFGVVGMKIFAPEQAAVLARSITQQNAIELLHDLRAIAVQYAEQVVSAAMEDATLVTLQAELVDARPLLLAICATAEAGQRPTEGQLDNLESLEALAALYTALRDKVAQTADMQQTKAGEGASAVRGVDDDLGVREHTLRRIIDDRISRSDPTAYAETAGGVRARGQRTLDEHWASCEADWGGAEAALLELSTAVRPLVRQAAGAHSSLSLASNALRDMVSAEEFTEAVDRLNADVILMYESRLEAETLLESAGRLRALLAHALLNILLAHSAREGALTHMQSIIETTRTIQELPLFTLTSEHSDGA